MDPLRLPPMAQRRMPVRGRPRLTSDDYEARVRAYCAKYSVRPGPKGLPPFPAGKRETPQHREWMGLYKLQNRLGRRERRQCERCGAPLSDGSVFCEVHRAGVAALAGSHGASVEDRQRLLSLQTGACPICRDKVDLWDSVDHSHATSHLRGILHQRCNHLVGIAESLGPECLDRVRAYLWPPRARSAR